MIFNHLDLRDIPFVDNHAHSLTIDYLQFSKNQFRSCFTESSDSTVIERDVPQLISYNDMLNCLKSYFDFETEDEYINLRKASSELYHVKKLFEDLNYKTVMVDDGYDEDSNIDLRSFANLLDCEAHRILRVETEIEKLLLHYDTVEEILNQFESLVRKESNLVGFKTIAAYRGGLNLTSPSLKEAKLSLETIKSNSDQFRLSGEPLHHYILHKVFKIAQSLNLPVQVHCGFGDTDLDLLKSNPACLSDIFKSEELADTKFVLLHCYPYVKEASYLASVFSNVYMDLSLAPIMVSGQIESIYTESLSLAPVNKVLAGTDGHSIPEMHWYGVVNSRAGLTKALNKFIEDDMITKNQAIQYSKKVLGENAEDLYSLS